MAANVKEAISAAYLEAWSTEGGVDRFAADPRGTLERHGADLTGLEVTIQRTDELPAMNDEISASLDQAIDEGRLELWISDSPPSGVEITELDESELAKAAGGLICTASCCCK